MMKVKLSERYLGSQVHEEREIKPKRDDRNEDAEIVAVIAKLNNGQCSVIVSERGVIVTSIRGVEHDIRFQF